MTTKTFNLYTEAQSIVEEAKDFDIKLTDTMTLATLVEQLRELNWEYIYSYYNDELLHALAQYPTLLWHFDELGTGLTKDNIMIINWLIVEEIVEQYGANQLSSFNI